MSLILEALRKSEAERHGRPNGSSATTIQPTKKSRLSGYLLGLAGVAALSIVLYFVFKKAEDDLSVESTQHQLSVVEQGTPVAVPSIQEQKSPIANRPKSEQAAVAAFNSEDDLPLTTQQAEKLNTLHTEPVETIGSSKPITQQASDFAQALPISTPESEIKLPEPIRREELAVVQPEAESTAGKQPDSSSAIAYSSLTQNQREKLGEPILNMHVYAENPKSRFILLNLKRYQQGDQFGAVQIDEITPQGVILEFEGQSYLLSAQQ